MNPFPQNDSPLVEVQSINYNNEKNNIICKGTLSPNLDLRCVSCITFLKLHSGPCPIREVNRNLTAVRWLWQHSKAIICYHNL